MINKKLQIILYCIIMLGFCQLTLADEKIKLKLHQPPPNKLGAGDLWKLDITNTTKEDIAIYIQGTATEEKDGLIVDGKSKVFTVKPGKKTYGYNDFKDGEVNWKNKTTQEAILRTGNVKSGSYTICVTAFYENGSVADNESCITQIIENLSQGTIALISPSDGEELDPDTSGNLAFLWAGISLEGPYNLRIVELRGSQSHDEAIKENRPILDKKEIKVPKYNYSLSDPKLEKGKKYAWQVTSGDVKSEIRTINNMRRLDDIDKDKLVTCFPSGVDWSIGGNSIVNTNPYLGTCNNYPLIIGTSGTEKMRILTDGKIGIGVEEPNQELHVNGNILLTGPQCSLLFGDDPSHAWGDWGIEYQDGGLNFWTPFGSVAGLVNYRMFLKDNGCVGIGTTNFSNGNDPAYYKFSVNGKIRAKEIVVEANWSDFVFEKNYNLLSLNDVEKYIINNKHLPDIPPASEIEKFGIPLGKIQSLLLQKIEELFLHVIQKSKNIIELENENKMMQKKLNSIEKENKEIIKRLNSIEKKLFKQ